MLVPLNALGDIPIEPPPYDDFSTIVPRNENLLPHSALPQSPAGSIDSSSSSVQSHCSPPDYRSDTEIMDQGTSVKQLSGQISVCFSVTHLILDRHKGGPMANLDLFGSIELYRLGLPVVYD